MKKVVFKLLLLNLLFIQISISQNSDTYWNYRSRLDNQFLVIGGEQGKSIPAAFRNPLIDLIKWSDATIDLGWYIGVLASEHNLLLNESLYPSYNSSIYTLEDNKMALYYALNALQRLDYNAEISFLICFGFPSSNGFFIRDDVPNGFQSNFAGFSYTLSDYNSFNIYDKEMSQDQMYHLFLGLSLVRKLVPANTQYNGVNLIDLASSLASKIANHVANISNWTIKNPVCNKTVDRGAEAFGLAYGTNEAIKYITNGATNYDNNLTVILNEGVWGSLGNPTFPIHINSDNTHMVMALGAIGKVWNSTTMEKLMNLSTLQDFYLYPLLSATLYDPTNMTGWSQYKIQLKSIIYNMLANAPASGTFSPQPIAGINGWGSNNRFIRKKSEHINGSSGSLGQEYNGLDYMLLYNLYYTLYGCQEATFLPLPQENLCNSKIDIDLTPYGQPTGGTFSGSGVLNGQYFNPSVAGPGIHHLYYTIENGNDCLSTDSIAVTIEVCSGTDYESFNFLSNIQIYPNPIRDNFSVIFELQKNVQLEVKIVDELGRIQSQFNQLNYKSGKQVIEISSKDWVPGLYCILFYTDGKLISTNTIIK